MAKVYSSVVNHWRAFIEYSTSQTDDAVTINASAGMGSYGWGFSITYDTITATLSNNGASKSASGNFSSASGATVDKAIVTNNQTVTRTHSAQMVTLSATVQNASGYMSGTNSVSTTVTVPAKPSYTVTYNANNGSGVPAQQTKWHGESLALSSTKPTRTGYTFKGWNTAANGSGTSYASGATYTGNAALTLYAQWTAVTYTVAYNANGGSGAPASQTKTYGVTLTLSSTKPTRSMYNFKGWATSSGGAVAYAAGASYTNNAAVTLYAVWELAWTAPKITDVSIYRCDSSGNAADDGTYAKVTFNWSTFSSSFPSTTVKCVLNGATVSGTAGGSSGSYAGTFSGLSTETSYTAVITVSDKQGTSTWSGTVPAMHFHLDFSRNFGVGLGGIAETDEQVTAHYPVLLKQGERNMRIGKNASGATWVKLGAWSGTSDSDTLALEVCTGPGYNGWTNQNVKLEVIVKNGYQATPGATADSGNRNPFAATCVLSHSGAYNGSIKLKVLATSHSDCDVWLYAPFGYSWGDLAVKSSGGEWETLNATQTDEPSGNECPVRVTASSQLYYGNGYWGFTTPDVSGSSENTNDYLRVPSAGIIPYKSGGSSSNLGTSGWPFGNAYMQWAAAYQLFAYQLRLYNSQADAFAQGTAPVVFDCESSVPKLWYNSTTGGLSGSFLATLWSGTWSSGSITVANFAKYNVFLVWQQNMPFPAVCFKNVVNAAATDIEGGACGISTTDTSYSKGLTSHVLIRMTSTTTWEWRGSYIYQMPYSTSTFLRESRNIVKIQGVI